MSDAAYHRRTTCRLCDSPDLDLVFGLTSTPPANSFVGADAREKEQQTFPLEVYMCRACAHVQLLDVVDPEALFADYVYVSGTSTVFVRHFEELAEHVRSTYAPDSAGQLAVDIGSNDGTLLRFFKANGMRVLGVDPAVDIAAAATADGIDTIPDFFTARRAAEIAESHGPARIVTANNVFAHADDLRDITDGLRTLLAPDGVFVFEVSYLVDVFEKTLFDTIYHEHLAYHTVKPLVGFLARHGMELIAVERVDSHGGSLRGIAQRQGGPLKVTHSVDELIALESRLGLHEGDTLRQFGAKIDAIKTDLVDVLREMKKAGKRIAGFGAPAKATTLMYHFGLGPETIDFIVDDSPLKQGLYTPGMHIPILPSEAIYRKKPDSILILAWNFADSIMNNHNQYRELGGQFIVPLPRVEVF